MPDADEIQEQPGSDDELGQDIDGEAGAGTAAAASKKKKRKKKKTGGGGGSKVSAGPGVVLSEDGKNLIWDEWSRKVLGIEDSNGETTIPAFVPTSNSDSAVEDLLANASSKSSKTRRNRKQYVYSGSLRPGQISPQVKMPEKMAKPDYAEHPEGHCIEEQEWPESKVPILADSEMPIMREACRLGREILDIGARYVCRGVTGDQIDKIVTEACRERNIYPSPLNYYNFPKSLCVSANEVICHGIPDSRPFEEGDIVNLDISIYHQGFHSDLNETFFVGKVSAESEKVVRTAYECLLAAARMIKPGTLYRSLGNEITKVATANQCSVVSTYCGHGIGRLFHGPPQVPHYKGAKVPGLMKVGHIFTIEPMINLGLNNPGDGMWPDDWTAVTLDGARSAQFEHTFLVTDTGYEVLTARDGKSKGEPMPEWNKGWFQK